MAQHAGKERQQGDAPRSHVLLPLLAGILLDGSNNLLRGRMAALRSARMLAYLGDVFSHPALRVPCPAAARDGSSNRPFDSII
jgi:hypothetical protein